MLEAKKTLVDSYKTEMITEIKLYKSKLIEKKNFIYKLEEENKKQLNIIKEQKENILKNEMEKEIMKENILLEEEAKGDKLDDAIEFSNEKILEVFT